ncbi:Structural maintenance of chromosomes protein 1B, partial [Perkinsus olseni]
MAHSVPYTSGQGIAYHHRRGPAYMEQVAGTLYERYPDMRGLYHTALSHDHYRSADALTDRVAGYHLQPRGFTGRAVAGGYEVLRQEPVASSYQRTGLENSSRRSNELPATVRVKVEEDPYASSLNYQGEPDGETDPALRNDFDDRGEDDDNDVDDGPDDASHVSCFPLAWSIATRLIPSGAVKREYDMSSSRPASSVDRVRHEAIRFFQVLMSPESPHFQFTGDGWTLNGFMYRLTRDDDVGVVVRQVDDDSKDSDGEGTTRVLLSVITRDSKMERGPSPKMLSAIDAWDYALRQLVNGARAPTVRSERNGAFRIYLDQYYFPGIPASALPQWTKLSRPPSSDQPEYLTTRQLTVPENIPSLAVTNPAGAGTFVRLGVSDAPGASSYDEYKVPEYPKVDRLDGVKRCYVTEIRVIISVASLRIPLTIPAIPLITQSSSTGDDRSANGERVPLALTGIIGPNGSGKSNLLDAVCFCLCVGAKRLRNDRLRSLVNSNRTMESQGDCTASASLTVRIERELPPGEGDASMEHTIVSHTTFTRSVTIKSADNNPDRGADDETDRNDDRGAAGAAVGSVYRVNDRACTQAQYKEELSKHHLDADASFFLVLQGQIDKLLSKDDAMSITKAIESASGSWRYRKDYDIVAKKKEHAQDNVTRLTAKRKQINQELNALAAQVQEADRYRDKRAELERKQLDKVTYSLYEIEKEADALLESSEGLLESYEDAKAAVQEAKRKENAAGEETKLLAEEHKRLQNSLEKVRKKQGEAEITAAELRGRKKQLAANEAKAAAGLTGTRGKLESLEERLQNIDDESAEIEACLEALAVRRDTIDDEVGGGVLTEEIVAECGRISETAQEVAASIESSIRVSKEQRTLLDQYINETKATITRLEETQGIRQRESHAAEADMNALREKMSERELAVAEERRKRGERREATSMLKERLEKTKQERRHIVDELSMMRANHRESERAAKLRTNVDQLIKEGPVARPDANSLNSADGGDGLILGLVSDLVHPSHKKYYQAIRAAIGRQHLEAVVVGSRRDALACIKWLKEKRIPPMTFIPLKDMELPPCMLSKEDIPPNSGLRRAEDCVKAANHVPSHLQGSHASHRSIIELIQKLHRWLLSKTVVADSLAQARSVLYHSGRRNAPAMPSGMRVVTLDGDKIAKNGNMSNGQGALPGDSGDVWDAQHVDSIKAELAQKDREIARIEEELRELTGTDGVSDEAVGDDDDDDPMDASLEMSRVEMGSLEKIKRVADEEASRLGATIEACRGNLAELKAQRDEAVNHLRELEEELSDKTKSFYDDINRRVFGEDDDSGDGDRTRDVMSLIRERKEVLDTIEAEVCKLHQQRDTLRGKREALEAD